MGDATVHAATLEIASDNLLAVHMNGEKVADNGRRSTFKQAVSFDLTDALLTGWNRLDLEVTNLRGSRNPASNPAGVLYCLTVDYSCTEGDCPILDQELPEAGIIED
jgi:hypothetical protein